MEVKCKVIFIYPKYVDHIKGCIQNYGLNFSILLFNLRFCRLREGSIKLNCPTQLGIQHFKDYLTLRLPLILQWTFILKLVPP